jgi:hypothetical protein
MLAQHDEQTVIDALRPVMAKARFKRRESTWYRFSPETVQILDVQAAASRSPQRVYFNLGVTFRELRPPTHLRVFDCPVYGRLDHIIPADEPFSAASDFADATFSLEDRISSLVDFVRRFALPLLDSWQTAASVRAFTQSGRSKGFTVTGTQKD